MDSIQASFRSCRQDTWSDLQLFGVVNLIVILAFGWLKTNLVDAIDSLSREDLASKPLWNSIYEAGPLVPAAETWAPLRRQQDK